MYELQLLRGLFVLRPSWWTHSRCIVGERRQDSVLGFAWNRWVSSAFWQLLCHPWPCMAIVKLWRSQISGPPSILLQDDFSWLREKGERLKVWPRGGVGKGLLDHLYLHSSNRNWRGRVLLGAPIENWRGRVLLGAPDRGGGLSLEIRLCCHPWNQDERSRVLVVILSRLEFDSAWACSPTPHSSLHHWAS